MAPPALRLERLGSVGEAREDWARLAERSGNPFATVEWSEAWLGHAAAGCNPSFFVAGSGESTVAIVPLVVSHGRYVRKARFLGFGAANELGPVCAPADRELGIEALRLAL